MGLIFTFILAWVGYGLFYFLEEVFFPEIAASRKNGSDL